MDYGDLNNPVYREMYDNVIKYEKYNTIKDCINRDIKEEEQNNAESYMRIIKRRMLKGFFQYPEDYKDEYTFIERVIEKYIPVNVYDIILEEIDKEIKKLNVDNTILENKDFLLFKLNKNLMNILYENTQTKKYLLFVNCENENYKEIIVSYNTDTDTENTIFSLKIEDKEYTHKIDYNNPINGLCYYNNTEKIVITKNKIGKLILEINGSVKNSCVYTLYEPVSRCGNEN